MSATPCTWALNPILSIPCLHDFWLVRGGYTPTEDFTCAIKFDNDKMEFTYYGRQRIERRTSILTRELVTAGQLKRVPRTDNNPHGLLITNWRTLLNKDVEQKTKNNY